MTTQATTKPRARKQKMIKGAGSATVYNALKKDILTLALKPGSPLEESAIAARFEISRSPVREALIKLVGEGLASTLPNRNTIVAPFDFEALPQYLDALDLMQRVTMRLAASQRNEEDIERLRKMHDEFMAIAKDGDPLTIIDANYDFHVEIARIGRNTYFTKLYSHLLNEGKRMLTMYYNYLGASNMKLDAFSSEHGEMVDAIADGDVERADKLGHQHTEQFRGRFMEYLTSSLSRGFPLDHIR